MSQNSRDEFPDPADYRQHCRRMLDRFGTSTDPLELERMAKAGLLVLPSTPDEAARLLAIARTAVERADPDNPRVFWLLLTLGLGEYRAGDTEAALKALDHCLERPIPSSASRRLRSRRWPCTGRAGPKRRRIAWPGPSGSSPSHLHPWGRRAGPTGWSPAGWSGKRRPSFASTRYSRPTHSLVDLAASSAFWRASLVRGLQIRSPSASFRWTSSHWRCMYRNSPPADRRSRVRRRRRRC
jgi:hypothetical protein